MASISRVADDKPMIIRSVGGSAFIKPTAGVGPKGADGSNVLPTDTAIANAVTNTTSATAAALATVSEPLRVGGKRSVRKDELLLNLMDYGAVGNGTTDDTAALNAAAAVIRAAGGGAIFAPPGYTYPIRLARINCSNVKIYSWGGGATFLYRGTGAAVDDGMLCWGDQASVGGTTTASNFKNIHIEGITFKGLGSVSGLNENQGLIKAAGVSDFTVRKCTFLDMQGDGVTIFCTTTANTERHNEGITIDDCTFDGIANYGRQGVSIIEGNNVTIQNNTFKNLAAASMPGAVDVEPNSLNTWSVIRDITITGNTFDNCGGNTADIVVALTPSSYTYGNPHGINITGNYHVNSRKYGAYVTWPTHAASASDPDQAIVISGNILKGSGSNTLPAYYIGGLRGVTIKGNQLYNWTSNLALLGAASTIAVDGVQIIDNRLVDCGGAVSPLIIGTYHTNTTVRDNKISRSSSSLSAIFANGAGGTSSNLKVMNNDCTGATVSAIAVNQSGHTTTASGNRARGNINAPAPNTAIFGAAPNVTGSRSDGTGLANLLTILANDGVIRDGTTA